MLSHPQPKYIQALKRAAERRKLEGELVYEHMAQKEIEKDREEFKDKESFVTSAYKKKLAERKALEEELAREAAIEGEARNTSSSSSTAANYFLLQRQTMLRNRRTSADFTSTCSNKLFLLLRRVRVSNHLTRGRKTVATQRVGRKGREKIRERGGRAMTPRADRTTGKERTVGGALIEREIERTRVTTTTIHVEDQATEREETVTDDVRSRQNLTRDKRELLMTTRLLHRQKVQRNRVTKMGQPQRSRPRKRQR